MHRMSRNLSSTCCYFCGGTVTLTERPRPMTQEDCGAYYYETRNGYGYAGAIVAHAICFDCEAKYIAHVDFSACPGYGNSLYFHGRSDGQPFFDLSFRQSFNDEPGPDDLPNFEFVRVRQPVPMCPTCGEKMGTYARCKCPKVTP